MDADDSVKKAVKSEKERLKEHAEFKKDWQKLSIEFSNKTPSRVKVDVGKELIIEPKPLLDNIFSYIFSLRRLTDFFNIFAFVVGIVLVINWVVSYIVSQFRIPISERETGMWVFVFVTICMGMRYVVRAVKEISDLNEPFHLKVSGKNFIVHTGNPEEYIAASTKVDSDGEWNIMAEIDETKESLKFTWAYGPDINNLTTGDREYTKHTREGTQQYLKLSDVELIRKFLNDNGIEITTDRRIDE